MTLEQIVMDRISELLRYRAWWRRERWADWPEIRVDHEIELRALVRLARQWRREQAAKPDPMDSYKSYADWTEAEKAGAWGR